MKTQTQIIPDWIVICNNGKHLVVDNESLKNDGIIAHALNSVHDSCAEAKDVCRALNGERDDLADLIEDTTILGAVTSKKLADRIRRLIEE